MGGIRAADPAVIVLHGWRSALERRVAAWLHTQYVPALDGGWRVFLRPDVARASGARRAPEQPAQALEQLLDGADDARHAG